MLWPGIMATSFCTVEMPGLARSIIYESTPGNTQAETGNASTAHHQNRSAADGGRAAADRP